MTKREQEIWEIIIETITLIAAGVFFGLQIYYVYVYESGILTLLYHLLPMFLLYAGLTVLQIFPELLKGFGSEPLQGKVRIYAVRMVRNSKMLVVFGILVPAAADVLGVKMNAAYSLLIMAAVLGNIGYYLYRIYQYNLKGKK